MKKKMFAMLVVAAMAFIFLPTVVFAAVGTAAMLETVIDEAIYEGDTSVTISNEAYEILQGETLTVASGNSGAFNTLNLTGTSTITINAGGTLEIAAGVTLALDATSNIIVQNGGQLVMQSGATLTLADAKITGYGTVSVADWATLKTALNADVPYILLTADVTYDEDINITPSNDPDSFDSAQTLTVDEGVTLSPSGDAKIIVVENAVLTVKGSLGAGTSITIQHKGLVIFLKEDEKMDAEYLQVGSSNRYYKFDTNGGAFAANGATIAYIADNEGNIDTSPSSVTKPGYTHVGWTYTNASGEEVFLSPNELASHPFTHVNAGTLTRLTAQWVGVSSSRRDPVEDAVDEVEDLLDDLADIDSEDTDALEKLQKNLESAMEEMKDLSDRRWNELLEEHPHAVEDLEEAYRDVQYLRADTLELIDFPTGVTVSGAMPLDEDGSPLPLKLEATKITSTDDLNAAQKITIGENFVLDLQILLDGEPFTDFVGDTVTVSMPYTLKEDETVANLRVYYVDEEGTKTLIESRYQNGILTFSTMHFPLYMVAYEENPFTDVVETAWFYDAVIYVLQNEIMRGVSIDEFDPNATATRAMIWTVLATIAGEEIEGDAMWYSLAQEWAIEVGVSDGENPNSPITREQLVSMLLRFDAPDALTTQNLLGQFPDADQTSDWAVSAMEWAIANGIISGKSDGTLDPQGTATRAEIASIIMRYMAMK